MAKISRVLVFTTSFRPMIGGSEIALEEIIRRLPDVFFDILTPRYRFDLRETEYFGNVCVHRIGFGLGTLDKMMFPVACLFKAVNLVRVNGYTKVHAYQASYGGGAVWLLKLFYPKLKFILTIQEGKNLEKQNFFIKFFRTLIVKKADLVTCISSYLAEYIRKINSDVEVVIIPNGVDLEKFKIVRNDGNVRDVGNEQLEQARRSLKQSDPSARTIITVSRLVEKNGVQDLIDAFYLLLTKHGFIETKLLIIGDGPLMKDLRFKIYDLRIQDKVGLLRSVSPDNVPKYLAQADVFVRPSLSEGLGTAFLEAMAVGVPVIGTSVGGISDFLKDGETGLFCRVNDPKNLAEKMERILTDESLRTRVIKNGLQLVEEKYDWNKIALKFKDIYTNATI